MANKNSKPRSFYQRFALKIGLEEAKDKFVARAHNRIFEQMYFKYRDLFGDEIIISVADALGRRTEFARSLSRQVGEDFNDVLKAIEGFHAVLAGHGRPWSDEISGVIGYLLRNSEIDLGIRWRPPFFVPAGAEELDESLVNDNLLWLREDSSFEGVLKPYEKGLRHLLHSQNRPEVLSDVITDMYESLEALAKLLTGRDSDLSGNAELFIKKIKASDEYKAILKNYIDYSNRFRHAARRNQPRPVITARETESFVYLTGFFLGSRYRRADIDHNIVISMRGSI
jgi:hypothetical protein